MSAALSEFIEALFFDIVSPAVENTRSDGADVAGIQSVLNASTAKRGNR